MNTYNFLFPALGVFLSGCAVGYNTTLFTTKSNVGLDVDTKPPTAEISIARREGVIAPAFESGKTPPVIASFGTNSNPLSSFLFGVQSTFAGGDAAVALSNGPRGAQVTDGTADLCLSQKPEAGKFLFSDRSLPEPGSVRPFVFGTDTSLGLKVAWSGITAQFPDTIRLGFSRKEMALAPVFGREKDCETDGKYGVGMPPFIAVLDGSATGGTVANTGVKWLQYFATGRAATNLGNNDGIRQIILGRLEPDADFSKVTYSTYPELTCVDAWLAKDRNTNVPILNNWWNSKGLNGLGTTGILDINNQKQTSLFISENNITCS